MDYIGVWIFGWRNRCGRGCAGAYGGGCAVSGQTSFTPGPWEIDSIDRHNAITIWGAPKPDVHHEICRVDTMYRGNYRLNLANARLIAAAPELLSLLSDVCANGGSMTNAMLFAARVAIAKATGGAE